MSSARDSNWSPQPPNLQELEKKEAAAMPVMLFSGAGASTGVKKRGRPREPGRGGKQSLRVHLAGWLGGWVAGWVGGEGGLGAPQRALKRRSRHRGQADSTAADAAGEAGGTVGGWDGLRLPGGRLRHRLSTCRDVWLLRFYSCSEANWSLVRLKRNVCERKCD